MARKEHPDTAHDRKVDAARKKAVTPKVDGWKGFVQVELNEAQKMQVKALRDNAMPQVWANVVGLIDEGYKLSLSFDTYNDAYVCAVTSKDVDSPNNGLTLTSRGGTLDGAVASFWYKHTSVLDGVWNNVPVKGIRKVGEDDVG